jgi:hypothetical protein
MGSRLAGYWLVLLVVQSANAGIIQPPAILTVGGDPMECDYGTLQDAIDDANSGDTIRMQQGNWVGPGVTITNKALTIVGGYSDCNDTEPDPNSPTTLTEAFTSTVLTVSSNIAGVQDVLVRHFTLRTGEGGATKGGGVDLSGAVSLRLDNVNVQENEADYGGGIRIHGGPPSPTLSIEGGSRIGGTGPFNGSNSASLNGGGIYCSGGALIEWREANINYNNAFDGGGLYLNDCDITTPNFSGNDLRVTEVRGNSAVNSAGGIALVNGSVINLSSRPNRQVLIFGNSATFDGGGIWAINSTVTLLGARIDQNSVGQTGGGAYLSDSIFSLTRGAADGGNCPQPPRCATIWRNGASTNAGAVFGGNGSGVILTEVFVESNSASSIPGMLFNAGSTAVLRNVQVAGNTATNPGGTRLFFLNDAELDIRHMTAALNQVHFGFEIQNGAKLEVHDSILWQPSATMIDDDGTTTLDQSCNNSSDAVTLPGSASHDPGFSNTTVEGQVMPVLFLSAQSQNIDRCDDAPAPPLIDLYGSARVVDVAGVVNGAGPLDRGAYEFEPALFADGFED